LSTQSAWFFERFLSKKPDQNNALTGLILGVFIFVLLLTVMNFALAFIGEQFEFDEDDLGFLDLGSLNPNWAHCFFAVSALGFELSVFPTIRRLEYLKSHIGEKRPADSILQLNHSLFRVLFPWTALFLMPSFCLFCGKANSLNRVVQVLAESRPTQFRSKSIGFYSRRFVPMHERIQFSFSRKKT
jgi:hypothetical protein